MKTATYQLERIAHLWDEAMPLMLSHYEEVAHYQDIALSPDIITYERLDQMGVLKVYTARVEGRLVGYACFMVKTNPHYSESLQAVQDVLFVLPEYRASRIGIGLIKHCDAELRQLGVQVVYQHVKCKESLDFSPLLERIGYELIDRIYGKRLDQPEK